MKIKKEIIINKQKNFKKLLQIKILLFKICIKNKFKLISKRLIEQI